ncbi:MAG: hypothetical protein V4503_07215 [Gemmatimonadota bacterium]
MQPFDLVFGTMAEERFPPLQAALPPRPGIDQFLLSRPVVELLRDLRPEEGLGEGVDEFVAFVHACFRYWEDGQRLIGFDEPATRALCETGSASQPTHVRSDTAYIQVAPRLVWGRLDEGDLFEPLDGWFALPESGGLRVVACFGVHPNRPGLSLLVVEGPPPGEVRREDGSKLFAPVMPGGDSAGLHAVVAPEELLLLAWRAESRMEA